MLLKFPSPLLGVTWFLGLEHTAAPLSAAQNTLLANDFPCCVIWGIKGAETERNRVISASPRCYERTGSAVHCGGEEERQEGSERGSTENSSPKKSHYMK